MPTRRAFLSSVTALAAAHSGLVRALPVQRGATYLSARLDASGQAFVSAFDAGGRAVFDIPLRHRGHAFAIHPRRAEIVAPARRPGRVMHVIDSVLGSMSREVASPQGRHFCGHAAFSLDGSVLFASETDYVAARGVIGVYDPERGYARVAEYESHGLDPHDIRVLAGGVLVVANGGILTHPDAPGANLNRDAMDPSLVYLDARDGRLLEQVRLPSALRQLSIRHLAVGSGEMVCAAMQYEGASEDQMPLVATHVRGGPLRLLDVPSDTLARLRNYCGSAAVDAEGALLAVSCPKGNRSVFFDLRQRLWLTAAEMPDGCGIAAAESPATFVLSSGLGGAARFDVRNGALDSVPGSFVGQSRWDNHLVRLTAPRPARQASA
jgi:uncharacterized protein